MEIMKNVLNALFCFVILTAAGNSKAKSSPDVMNQNVTVNLNVSPRQVKTISPMQEFFDHFTAATLPHEIIDFLYRQRYFIGAGAILGVYVLACRECVRVNQYLECFDAWSAWHKEYSLEILLGMPQQQIAKDLIIEIQRRYSNGENPTDFIGPLISFSKAIDYEIELVNHYLWLYSMLMRSRLYVLFPLNIEKCAELGNLLKKLQYIKNTFLAWAADYKIEHNRNKCAPIYLLCVDAIG